MLPIGLHVGVPEEVYRADHGYNQSLLVDFLEARTPKHFIDGIEERAKDLSGKDFIRIGSAVDILITEPDRFQSRVIICPEDYPGKGGPKPWSRKAEFCKDWEAEKRKAGLITLTIEEKAQVDGTVAAILSHPEAGAFVANCPKQVVAIAQEPETGLRIKGRIDMLPGPETGLVVDLKTGDDASPAGFSAQCLRMYRHVQARFYCDLVRLAAPDTFTEPLGMLFIMAETSSPHGVAVHKMDAGSPEMFLGLSEYMKALKGLDRCRTLGSWPCYPNQRFDIKYPRYAFDERK